MKSEIPQTTFLKNDLRQPCRWRQVELLELRAKSEMSKRAMLTRTSTTPLVQAKEACQVFQEHTSFHPKRK